MFISFSFHLLEIHSGKFSCFLAFSLILHHFGTKEIVNGALIHLLSDFQLGRLRFCASFDCSSRP